MMKKLSVTLRWPLLQRPSKGDGPAPSFEARKCSHLRVNAIAFIPAMTATEKRFEIQKFNGG
jgi:hypothetical protein